MVRRSSFTRAATILLVGPAVILLSVTVLLKRLVNTLPTNGEDPSESGE